MGNAPSTNNPGGSASASTPNPSSSSAQQPTSTSTSTAPAAPTPTPPTALPTRGPITAPVPVFHSGLTPPPKSPSPPPPPTPPLLPHGGHLSPQNPHALSHPQAHDYSKGVVTRLVLDGMLAPFYRGLEDFEEDMTEEEIGKALEEVREKDYEEGIGNSVVEGMKAEREGGGGGMGATIGKKIGMNKNKEMRKAEEREERDRRERKAYLGATECPICFLNYPPNINTSRCCQQPICTECFVQIKRSEATITHLESESACCPFCMETDFGVIYERPIDPIKSMTSSNSNSALAISPEGQSGFSQALSLGDGEADQSVGVGMAPKQQETARRKSVNAKDKQVVTIDQIRPDWEDKLNAVKAAAARKASRRIVMRQVGDRLIPIGYTSARAPGTADFSMSVPPGGGEGSTGENGSRRERRRGSGRERDLEELMIMEAMRLSMLDHEEHQRKINTGDMSPNPAAEQSTNASAVGSRRGSLIPGDSTPSKAHSSAASKLFSKFGNRSRSGSAASSFRYGGGASGGDREQRNVSFASNVGASSSSVGLPSGSSASTGGRPASGSISTPSPPAVPADSTANPPSPVAIKTSFPSSTQTQNQGRNATPPASLTPTSSMPVAPITTLADATASPTSTNRSGGGGGGGGPEGVGAGPAGLPRISLDMAPLAPSRASMDSAPGLGGLDGKRGFPPQPARLTRAETGLSEVESVGDPAYAQLDSDGE